MNITKFEIKGLHDRLDYSLKFNNNRLILVGENGSGKTTVLRILFLVINNQWSELCKYKFDSISIHVDGKSFPIVRADLLKDYLRFNGKFLPRPVVKQLEDMLLEKGSIDDSMLRHIASESGIPYRYLISKFNNMERADKMLGTKNSTTLKELRSCIAANHILYLPTYRRIEQELRHIFSDVDENEFRRPGRRINTTAANLKSGSTYRDTYTELIEFGMKDVQEAIAKRLEHLKDFTSKKLNILTQDYLRDVVDGKYKTVDVNKIKKIDDNSIDRVLEISTSIWSKKSKNNLLKIIKNIRKGQDISDEHQKVVCHYFSKLLGFGQELKAEEENISGFCATCNNYMVDKQLKYTSSDFSFAVRSKKHEYGVELEQLSSGEKQIVSLFSHLYLAENKKFFVMIDEPELSLSVPWQRTFLEDISKSELCAGFFAVTHSPFIYENKLEKYAHGIGEFMSERKRKK